MDIIQCQRFRRMPHQRFDEIVTTGAGNEFRSRGQRQFYPFARRDIGNHAIQPAHPAQAIECGLAALVHPAQSAVGMHNAVLDAEGGVAGDRLPDREFHQFAVRRINDAAVAAHLVGDEIRNRIAAQFQDVIAHEMDGPVRIHLAAIHHARNALHQAGIAGFVFAQPALRFERLKSAEQNIACRAQQRLVVLIPGHAGAATADVDKTDQTTAGIDRHAQHRLDPAGQALAQIGHGIRRVVAQFGLTGELEYLAMPQAADGLAKVVFGQRLEMLLQ